MDEEKKKKRSNDRLIFGFPFDRDAPNDARRCRDDPSDIVNEPTAEMAFVFNDRDDVRELAQRGRITFDDAFVQHRQSF